MTADYFKGVFSVAHFSLVIFSACCGNMLGNWVAGVACWSFVVLIVKFIQDMDE